MENLKYIIESLLFVSDTPIMLKQIHYIMPDIKMSQIRKAVEELTNEYNERVGSFYLSNVAGGIQLRSRPVYKEWIKRFIRSRPIRLSRAALEALAIVAYKQPVTRSEVDKIRGVDSGAIMRSLVENKLIRIIGRKEVPGRPMLYTTSKRFLEVFDLNDLKDLPAPDDLEISEEDQEKIAEKFDINEPAKDENEPAKDENDPANDENESATNDTLNTGPKENEISEPKDNSETPDRSEDDSKTVPESSETNVLSEDSPLKKPEDIKVSEDNFDSAVLLPDDTLKKDTEDIEISEDYDNSDSTVLPDDTLKKDTEDIEISECYDNSGSTIFPHGITKKDTNIIEISDEKKISEIKSSETLDNDETNASP